MPQYFYHAKATLTLYSFLLLHTHLLVRNILYTHLSNNLLPAIPRLVWLLHAWLCSSSTPRTLWPPSIFVLLSCSTSFCLAFCFAYSHYPWEEQIYCVNWLLAFPGHQYKPCSGLWTQDGPTWSNSGAQLGTYLYMIGKQYKKGLEWKKKGCKNGKKWGRTRFKRST